MGTPRTSLSKKISSSEGGQAAVEAALTMPLMLFMMLGTMQLFMMMHARVLTQLAAFQVTRTGSLNHGNCQRMLHSGILQLLPAIEPFAKNNGIPVDQNVGRAFGRYAFNTYNNKNINAGTGRSEVLNSTVLWIVRDLSGRTAYGGPADNNFDQSVNPMTLETQVIFWFPMKVPFANWVIARIMLAHYGIQAYGAQNPLMINMRATNWSSGTPSNTLFMEIRNELAVRLTSNDYVFPIVATSTMRMMTPMKRANYAPPALKNCPGTPSTL